MAKRLVVYALSVLLIVACGVITYCVARAIWISAVVSSALVVVLITSLLTPWYISLDLENKLKVWDGLLKTVTAVILIVTAIVGVKQYLSQRDQLIKQNTREFNSMIYRTRLDLYQEATDTLSKFAYAPNTAEAETADRRFWELFDGKISILEDQEVADEMRLCIDFLEEWEKCKDKTPTVRENLFANLAYDFSQSCRRSLQTAFPEAVNPFSRAGETSRPLVTRELLPCVCSSADEKLKPICDEQSVPVPPPR